MADKSKIEWTDASWTPIRARVKADAAGIAAAKGYTSMIQVGTRMAGRVGPHCERISPGCENCYSQTNNGRCLPVNGTGLPFDRRARDLVDIILDDRMLMQPLHWRRSKWIFVCSQTDLFGEFVPYEMIDRVFAVMALSPHHSFQVLTKRAERMREYFANSSHRQEVVSLEARRISVIDRSFTDGGTGGVARWPLPNVIVGVSVEDRKRLHRIEALFNIPAAVRFASLEPLLEDLGQIGASLMRHCPKCGRACRRGSLHCSTARCDGQPEGGLDWVIVGGESGPGARQCDPQWVRSIRDQCLNAYVPFFFKQWGAWMPVEDVPRHAKRSPGQAIRGGMIRVGKKAAGRLLDGRTWDEMPQLSSLSRIWGRSVSIL